MDADPIHEKRKYMAMLVSKSGPECYGLSFLVHLLSFPSFQQQQVSNRERKLVEIELDDIKDHFR